jgi:hypothetical protein
VPKSKRFHCSSSIGCGRGLPKLEKKAKVICRLSAPLRCMSSPRHQSAIGACGDTAFSAGWLSIAAIDA